jgi:hypothetical protein
LKRRRRRRRRNKERKADKISAVASIHFIYDLIMTDGGLR